MKVLSLYDGCACAMQALKNLGIECDYYASEIDKFCIKIAETNHDITSIGDVTELDNIILDSIGDVDLLIGGSPCVGFSSAGLRKGLDDERSRLFFEYVRILKQVKPKHFIFENVNSSNKTIDTISSHIGVRPTKINSSLVSAQNRLRNYWCNFDVSDIKNENITVADILDNAEYNLYNYKIPIDKSIKLSVAQYIPEHHEQIIHSDKDFFTMKLKSNFCDSKIGLIKTPTIRALNRCLYVLDNNKIYRRVSVLECERLQTLPDGYTYGVSDTQRWKMVGNGFTVRVVEDIIANIL